MEEAFKNYSGTLSDEFLREFKPHSCKILLQEQTKEEAKLVVERNIFEDSRYFLWESECGKQEGIFFASKQIYIKTFFSAKKASLPYVTFKY